MDEVEVVIAHHERATLRVGDVYLKVDADRVRADGEVEAMRRAPVPTPEILWREPPVVALAALAGGPLGRAGRPATAAPPAAWVAAGAVARRLHTAPLPPWPGVDPARVASGLDEDCAWLVAHDVLPGGVVARHRRAAGVALRPWTPAFTHGDLQPDHVFVESGEVTGVLDWSEAAPGDALYDLASLTLGHEDRLADVLAGYGAPVDLAVIRAWWSARCLRATRWLVEHGVDPSPEVALLTAP